MKNILNKFNDFWFQAMPPERLAMLRIATGFFSLWYLVDRYKMMMDIVKIPDDLFEPVGLASLMTSPMPAEWFQGLLLVTIALNLMYILGFKF
ncbi:MAG: hypothetical protein HC817_16285, partial [Saprospiraceae bacterium]|nr:hypothetical protein [Saprospiraceae bacterium]